MKAPGVLLQAPFFVHPKGPRRAEGPLDSVGGHRCGV